MTAAVKYLEKNPAGTPVDAKAFDEACGVGESLYASPLTGQGLRLGWRICQTW